MGRRAVRKCRRRHSAGERSWDALAAGNRQAASDGSAVFDRGSGLAQAGGTVNG